MSALNSVDALIRALGEATSDVQGEWPVLGRFFAFHDEDRDLIFSLMLNAEDASAVARIAEHPALFRFGVDFTHLAADMALAGWALNDGALDAMLAAGADAEYSRAAHRAGATDAWVIIAGWEASIPVEYLGATS